MIVFSLSWIVFFLYFFPFLFTENNASYIQYKQIIKTPTQLKTTSKAKKQYSRHGFIKYLVYTYQTALQLHIRSYCVSPVSDFYLFLLLDLDKKKIIMSFVRLMTSNNVQTFIYKGIYACVFFSFVLSRNLCHKGMTAMVLLTECLVAKNSVIVFFSSFLYITKATF